MVQSKSIRTSGTSVPPPSSHPSAMRGDPRCKKMVRAVYARRMEKKQVFFQDLNEHRRQIVQNKIKSFFKMVGPDWYHVLSESQRQTLNKMERCIYKDLLEGRPTRVTQILKDLGIYKYPTGTDLLTCVYLGRKDPKQFFAQLFIIIYDHAFNLKRTQYSLNAKLILSSIFYLGQASLEDSLNEIFRVEKKAPTPPPKQKPKTRVSSISPYLTELIPTEPEKIVKSKKRITLTLPDFDKLEEAAQQTWSPPPPSPRQSGYALSTDASHLIPRHLQVPKYIPNKRKRIRPPKTDVWNKQSVIQGVFTVQGKSVFIIENMCILPPLGHVIHGGVVSLKGGFINIHDGIFAKAAPPTSEPCDCVKQWQDAVFHFLKLSKCQCEHYYDYGNEGEFPKEELLFFHKPTKYSPPRFDFANIFELDEANLNISKAFKNLWATDSILGEHGGVDKKEKKKNMYPLPMDYMRSALKSLVRYNLAAALPSVYETPEIKAWMRRRVYGALTPKQKEKLVHRCSTLATNFHAIFTKKNYGHINPQKHSSLEKVNTWARRDELKRTLERITRQYKFNVFMAQARMANLFWPIMFQADMPNKRFREIFFAYLPSRVSDVTLMRPYDSAVSAERARRMRRRPYHCGVTDHYK